MYDPEEALQIENGLISDQLLLSSIENSLGKNHPWTQRVSLIVDILYSISQRENSLVNCFDEEDKKVIEVEIDELLSIAKEALI